MGLVCVNTSLPIVAYSANSAVWFQYVSFTRISSLANPERTVGEGTTGVRNGVRGTYAETPKASWFQMPNAPSRDAKGVEGVDLCTGGHMT